jgi:hypothetical protein
MRKRVTGMNDEEIEKMIKEIREDHAEGYVKQRKIDMIHQIKGFDVPYIVQKRTYGEGGLRLGHTIDLDPSIYSYAYGLCICDEDITEFMDLLTGKVNKKEEKDEDEDENAVLAFLRERLGIEDEDEEDGGKKKKNTKVQGDSDEEKSAPLIAAVDSKKTPARRTVYRKSLNFRDEIASAK